MANENETMVEEEETAKVEKTHKKVSERLVLSGDGTEQEEWEGAEGFSYKSLSDNFTLMVMFRDLPESIVKGLTAFGALTLAGNVTNAIRNNKNAPADASEKDALVAWLENLKAGNWTKPSGEVEAGISTLAEAYVRVLEDLGETVDYNETLAKLREVDKETRKKIRSDAQVRAAFAAILADRAAARAETAPKAPLPRL